MVKSHIPDNPFWTYSLAHYGRREVAQACHNLQDTRGININLLLFCCWTGARGEKLDTSQICKAQSLIAEWDIQVVQRLRQLRRFLKECANATDQIRHEVANLELSSERVVQDMLAEWWLAEPRSVGTTSDQGVSELQEANLDLFLSLSGAPLPGQHSPLLWPLTLPRSPA
ncbi:MAG: TIGR02444 family protein [Gammaproteobacteria bacterium]|nr:MAG: TIGR02444 family protein [Gammaproteobacteria bacterium]